MEVVNAQSKDEWIEAVVKLIGLTQKQKLIWQEVSAERVPLLGRHEEKVEAAYQANHLGRTLLLTERLYNVNLSLHPSMLLGSLGQSRVRQVALEFVDERMRPLFTVPSSEAVSQLFKEVEFQHADKKANVRGYLDQLREIEVA